LLAVQRRIQLELFHDSIFGTLRPGQY
jgi:hypothetical protein